MMSISTLITEIEGDMSGSYLETQKCRENTTTRLEKGISLSIPIEIDLQAQGDRNGQNRTETLYHIYLLPHMY